MPWGKIGGANNNEEDVDFDLLAAEMENGDGELNEYSSNQFSLNERRHYFMDRAPISSQNRAAVEFVYGRGRNFDARFGDLRTW